MKKNKRKDQSEDMNYNDRPDGYGFGESESRDSDKDYQKDPHFTKHCIDLGEGYRCHKGEPFTKDEFGLRNQYGPVDQYTFRSYHLFTRDEESKELKEDDGDTSEHEENA